MKSKLERPGIQELCVGQRIYEFVKLNFGTFSIISQEKNVHPCNNEQFIPCSVSNVWTNINNAVVSPVWSWTIFFFYSNLISHCSGTYLWCITSVRSNSTLMQNLHSNWKIITMIQTIPTIYRPHPFMYTDTVQKLLKCNPILAVHISNLYFKLECCCY